MKQFFQFVSILFIALSFAACEGPRGPQGPQGPAGSCNIYTVYLHINPTDWRYDDLNLCYYVQASIKELTADVYDYGTVTCYREYNLGTEYLPYQICLPEVKHLMDNGTLYEQTIDYSFGIGFIEIVLTTDDFAYGDTESMDFRVNLMW